MSSTRQVPYSASTSEHSHASALPPRGAAFVAVNAFTLSRIPAVFAFMAAAIAHAHGASRGWAVAALAFLAFAALTDLVDGWLARRFAVTSRLGALADPLADKVFYLVTLPTVVYLAQQRSETVHALVLLAMTVLFLLRDQWVSFLRSVGAEYGVDARANWAGKLRTLLSFPFLCLLYAHLAFEPWRWPPPALYAVEGLLIALNLLSIAVYTRSYRDALRMALGGESGA